MAQRIVACQGPIQLVTAIAVLRQRDREQARAVDWDDYLAITELAAPQGQQEAFVGALRTMAGALRPWKAIMHLPQLRLLDMRSLALDDVREVYVVRHWQRSNQALLGAFPSATKICFGDSIGIYLAPTYMAPTARLVDRIGGFLRSLVVDDAGISGGPSADCYYLALPGAFDPVPSNDVKATDIALLRQAVEELRPLLPRTLLADLRRHLDGRRLVILVGSNFSEQGVMSQEAEIAAYSEYLAAQRFDRNSLLLLKPHPRDRMEKVRYLESALERIFPHVVTLTDVAGFYLPLETLVLEIRSDQEQAAGIEVCTFSSACLASQYILGLRPRIGFGAQLVRKYFSRPFVAPRLHHEHQLSAACGSLHAQQP